MARSRTSRPRASGRFVLRIAPGLHAALRAAAAAEHVSLNEYCGARLALVAGSAASSAGGRAVVERAAAMLGGDLVGALVFGSWARGEATSTSDVDVLIAVDARRAITRSIYRDWDADPTTWDGRPVEPHFVHLPELRSIGTLWAEAAIDGIVLFEREHDVSRQLAAVRREIVAGRLVRRIVHGQPYWAEVA